MSSFSIFFSSCLHFLFISLVLPFNNGLLWVGFTGRIFTGAKQVNRVLMSLFFSPRQDESFAVHETLREMESQCLSEISAMLNGEIPGEELGDLFFDCVDTEIKFYQ